MTAFFRCRLFVGAAALCFASAAFGAEPTQEQKDRARGLFKEGHEFLVALEFARALPLLEEAHNIMHVPTTAWDLMQAYGAMSKPVEAWKVAEEVQQNPAKPGEPEAFAEARQKIKEAMPELERMIPKIAMHIQGAPLEKVKVAIDDQPLKTEQLEQPYRVNPGKHRIDVRADEHRPADPRWLQPQWHETLQPRVYDVTIQMVPIAKPEPARLVEVPKARRFHVPLLLAGSGLMAVGIGTGIGAKVKYDAAEKAYACDDKSCREEYTALVPMVEGLSWTAVIAGSVGVAGFVASFVVPVVSEKPGGRDRVSLMIQPGLQGAALRVAW